MNEIEAIRQLEAARDYGVFHPSKAALGLAISALEEKIPKKVTEVKCIHDDYNTCLDCEIVLDCVLGNTCPACNYNLDYDCGQRVNHCPECGQKLDWSVEE